MAHGGSPTDATHYRSTVTAVEPPVPGLVVSLARAGESVTLTNHTGSTIIVFGYSGEQYLRITPTGVEENLKSLTASLNGSLVIRGLPPQPDLGTQPDPPRWSQVGDTPSFTWHDQRVHWIHPQRPAVVAADPQHPHRVLDWAIPLSVDGNPATINGALDWAGAPAMAGLQIAMIALGFVTGAVLMGAVILTIRQQRKQAPKPASERSLATQGEGGQGPHLT